MCCTCYRLKHCITLDTSDFSFSRKLQQTSGFVTKCCVCLELLPSMNSTVHIYLHRGILKETCMMTSIQDRRGKRYTFCLSPHPPSPLPSSIPFSPPSIFKIICNVHVHVIYAFQVVGQSQHNH